MRSVPPAVTGLMGPRGLFAPAVGASRESWDVFEVREVQGDEALIAHPDHHLDFRAGVGIDVEARLVWVTTAVWFHGRDGRPTSCPSGFCTTLSPDP